MQISEVEYRQFKPLLFSLGYRMLGSVMETEDLIQETFLKAYQINDEKIHNKRAFICKIMTNGCLDFLKSPRNKREQYLGPWNPEPLFRETLQKVDPSEKVIQKEGLSIAYLRMMEYLTPVERAVFLLREAFDFPYSDIANMIEKKEDNCRKIVSRAKLKLSQVQEESLSYDQNKAIVNRFIHAFQVQNTDTLLTLLSDNVTLFSDGGGKVKAAMRPIKSLPNVLTFLTGMMKKAPKDLCFKLAVINYQPAITLFINGKLYSTLCFYIKNDQIYELYFTLNPNKLPV